MHFFVLILGDHFILLERRLAAGLIWNSRCIGRLNHDVPVTAYLVGMGAPNRSLSPGANIASLHLLGRKNTSVSLFQSHLVHDNLPV